MKRKIPTRVLVLIFVFMVSVFIFLFKDEVIRYTNAIVKRLIRKTVQDRLHEHSRTVHYRLTPLFKKQNIPYPPDKIILVGIKAEKKLEIWAAGADEVFKNIRTYPILAASGTLGPKLKEGDRQVPEGIYSIEYLNPNSMFHLSLKINYPNDFDKKIAVEESRSNLGGDIMIHGNNVSTGCLAMGDEAAEDLFVLVAESGRRNVKVILSPVDFRKRNHKKEPIDLPQWIRDKYSRIKQEFKSLHK